MEHAARFIDLSNDPAADAEIMTGANLKQILNLLPLRIRQQDDEFNTAETNVAKKKGSIPENKRLGQHDAAKTCSWRH